MNLSETLITFSNSEIQSTARFVELLIKVQERVSSPELTSSDIHATQGAGFLDKIECSHAYGISTAEIRQKCSQQNFPIRGVKLKDKRLYLEVSLHGRLIHFYIGHPDNPILRKIFFNPSHFSNIFEMMESLNILLGPAVEDLVINRIDFTTDILLPFKEVLKGLDIKYKRANSEFIGNSNRTGLVVGTRDDQVKVYDKSQQLNLTHPLTRIERQVRGSSLLIKKLVELPLSLNLILNFKPLDIISIANLCFVDGECNTEEQFNRFNEFKVLIEHEGYFLAKKKLSKNGNFQRDYGKFFNLIEIDKQPNDYFEKGLTNFYKEVKK